MVILINFDTIIITILLISILKNFFMENNKYGKYSGLQDCQAPENQQLANI